MKAGDVGGMENGKINPPHLSSTNENIPVRIFLKSLTHISFPSLTPLQWHVAASGEEFFVNFRRKQRFRALIDKLGIEVHLLRPPPPPPLFSRSGDLPPVKYVAKTDTRRQIEEHEER